MQGRAQRVASGAEGAANLSIGSLGLDNHAAQVERILYKFASLLDSHAFLFAQLCQQSSIFLTLRVVQRVNDGSFVEVCEAPFGAQFLNFIGVTNEDNVCDVVSQYTVGGFKRALLSSFREHNALLITFCASNNLL